MNGESRWSRIVRWAMVVGASGLLPAFVLRCDKASLNFQRGLTQGLGHEVSEILADQILEDRNSEEDADNED
jgi:hypothetical protein